MNKYMLMYIGFFVIVLVCLIVFKEIMYRRKYKRLGKIVFSFKKEKQHQSFFSHFIRSFVMVALLIYLIVDKGKELDWGLVVLILLLSFMFVQFITPILMINKPYGIYENGAVTVVGAVLYNECRRFGFNTSGNGEPILVFQTKHDFLGGGSYLYIKEFQSDKYKKYIMRNCQYYNFNNSGRRN